MSHIFLIGMMGSGKTTTAKELSNLINKPVWDFDQLIEKKTGKSINKIFADYGETHFRNLETDVLKEMIMSNQPVIASTGGGLVIQVRNMDMMKSNGIIIYLKTSFSVLWERVKKSKHRPLIQSDQPEEKFLMLFNERTPIYQRCANYTVDTDGKTPRQVAIEIHETILK